MPKVFRRTIQRYQDGKAGVVTVPNSGYDRRSGNDGQIGMESRFEFSSATANFTQDDVGRMIILTNTHPRAAGNQKNKHDNEPLFIKAVTNSTTVTLGGTARWEDTGLVTGFPAYGVNWVMPAACLFEDAGASFPVDGSEAGPVVNQSISINDSSMMGFVPWLVGRRDSATKVMLIDWTNNYSTFTPSTGLSWFLHDRRAYNYEDLYWIICRFLLDCGWTLLQNRGKNGSFGTSPFIIRDVMFYSDGEDGLKRHFLRFTKGNATAGGKAATGNVNWGFDFSMYNNWDTEWDNGGTNSKGTGTASLIPYQGRQDSATGPGRPTFALSNLVWNQRDSSTTWTAGILIDMFPELAVNSLGIPGGELCQIDYCFYGDKDEVVLIVYVEGMGMETMCFGSLAPVTQNPNVFVTTSDVTGNANNLPVDINVGALNPEAVSPPYSIGDSIQIAGMRTLGNLTANGEYTESATIIAFDHSDPNNRKIRVNTLKGSYRAGALFGEDPQPVYMFQPWRNSPGTVGLIRFLNSAKYGHATWKDNAGFVASVTENSYGFDGSERDVGPGMGELNPNMRGGRWGLIPILGVNTLKGESRGRMRHLWRISNRVGAWQFIKSRDAVPEYYLVIPSYRNAADQFMAIGPMPRGMAKID